MPLSHYEPELPPHPNGSSWNEVIVSNIHQHDVKVNKYAFRLDNVFSPEECTTIINWAENLGYVKAALGHGNTVVEDIRKSDRCIIDTVEFSQVVFNRIKDFLPAEWNGETLRGLNERLRFLRYHPGGYFKPHLDGWYERPNHSEISYLTCQIYLNGGFEGGETTFFSNYEEKETFPCIPKAGRVLIFEHKIRHEGSLLKSGTKYAIRTDVMYTNSI